MSKSFDSPTYKHRDISWLSFNERVLQEASDKRNPLYERINFLAIFSSNLDEYFRVRVSKLRQIKNVNKSLRKKLNFRPTKTLKAIIETVELQQQRFGVVFREALLPELAENGIHLIGFESFDVEQQQFSAEFFKKQLHAQLDIIVPTDGTTFLTNNALYFYVTLDDDGQRFVSIPTENFDRFVVLPKRSDGYYLTFLDDIIAHQLQLLFPKNAIKSLYEIKLSRDAELYWDDSVTGEIEQLIATSLSQRKIGQPTRVLYDFRMPVNERKRLRKLLGVGKVDMFPGGAYHNYSDFFGFPDPTDNADLHFQAMPPLKHKFLGNKKQLFETISQKDQLLHYPYHSFDHVLNFLDASAEDPQVTTIKISLYRIAKHSKLGRILLKALKNGKEVTVFVEPKARFDEANNLDWSKKFKKKGAQVFYSDLEIKVHSKILLVTRLEGGIEARYAYISTGNFNGKTSKIYADHGLFTKNVKITDDLAQVFEVLERKRLAPVTKHLMVSPYSTRDKFNQLIDNEIKNAKIGVPAAIKAKMNSLQDKRIIDKLYEAALAGVHIQLLVRGFCCLNTGQAGVGKNMTITSIVDRYLEHGRLYWFLNDGDEKMFMGSADWMTRNLDRRIEVLTPIYDQAVFTELKDILELQLGDNVKARIIDADDQNQYVPRASDEPSLRSQYAIYAYLKNKVQP